MGFLFREVMGFFIMASFCDIVGIRLFVSVQIRHSDGLYTASIYFRAEYVTVTDLPPFE